MTADRAEPTPEPSRLATPSDPKSTAIGTPAQRRRFAIALGVFGLWVAFLAVLASRATPPDALPDARPPASGPGDDAPR